MVSMWDSMALDMLLQLVILAVSCSIILWYRYSMTLDRLIQLVICGQLLSHSQVLDSLCIPFLLTLVLTTSMLSLNYGV
jgi:hypothetical protein